jgi:hypothetical protein
VVVMTRGDDELLNLAERTGWHFPQQTNGVYEGYHPADSADAIRKLETVRTKGAEYLAIPSTSLWWLDHYRDFHVHLQSQYTEVIHRSDACVLYRLAPPAQRSLSAPALPAPARAVAPMAETSPSRIAWGDDSDRAEFDSDQEQAVRLIAFYLPQYHPIPENDTWWGEGFTEWTNVGRAQPLFAGHYQPHVPADLGFYDLRLADSREAQAELARQYGIHGFCYYHYWFAGKQLLERPFQEVLRSGRPEFPFCLCWANEPWSRRWNGRPESVLQAQEYSPGDDLAHIHWLLPALADTRAIRIEGKPVFLVYQGKDLPDPARTVETWRREVDQAGLPGVYLISVETGWDAGWDATQVGFDAKVLFQPQFTMLFNSGTQITLPTGDKPRVFDYEKAWPLLARPEPVAYRRYDTVFPSWDNSARTGENGVVVHNCSPAAYHQWLTHAVEKAMAEPPEHRVIFLNAWNEWGEGCHLEPDLRHGRAYLEATRSAQTGHAHKQAPAECSSI